MGVVLVALLVLVLVVVAVLTVFVARLLRSSAQAAGQVPASSAARLQEARELGARELGPQEDERHSAAGERTYPSSGVGPSVPGHVVAGLDGAEAGGEMQGVPLAPAPVDADVERLRERAREEVARAISAAEAESAAIRRRAEHEADAIVEQAKADATLRSARAEAEASAAVRQAAEKARADAEARLDGERDRLRDWDARLVRLENRLEQQRSGLDDVVTRLDARDAELDERSAALDRRAAQVAELVQARQAALEEVAGMTAAEARAELVRTVEQQARRDASVVVRDIEAEAREHGENRARRIVTLAIQRVASEQTAESVVSVLHLPSDDMKGRIIGREGRNIRAFESVTGVNVLIDDTPEAVLLSCFDPVRREVGRIALEALVEDGRIHPQRIEDEYQRAKAEVDARCLRAAEDALVAVGVPEMHPELIALLGRLRYRTSYGQNVLAHLVECAHLAGIMAAELRLPAEIAKRGTLLHDLGKALTHEVEGSHAIVGAEMARRYGEDEEVVHAIEAHHNEVEPRSIEAVLTQAADQISGGRPGARRESLESYVKRLERIEQIASDRPGVEKVFAMQAGREVRVMVVPELVDDLAAHVLAKEVAKQIEDELTYPGQIRVTVVRETRAIDVAR